jgi:hypothetical protein
MADPIPEPDPNADTYVNLAEQTVTAPLIDWRIMLVSLGILFYVLSKDPDEDDD